MQDALKYQYNLMNTLYVDNITKQIQIDFLQDENKHMKNVLEENKKLKKVLWEAETEYIHERYYDNPIREEESINELKVDFKRGYWND